MTPRKQNNIARQASRKQEIKASWKLLTWRKLCNCSCQMPHATAVAATARLCKVVSRDLSLERKSCWSCIWPWPKTLRQQCGRAAASLRLRQIKLIKWERVKLASLWPLATFRCPAHTLTHRHTLTLTHLQNLGLAAVDQVTGGCD